MLAQSWSGTSEPDSTSTMPRLKSRSQPVTEAASQLTPRFYTLDDVAVLLATTLAQVYALVRTGDLPAIKIGGREHWRVEVIMLDQWIAEQYEVTRKYVAENPMPETPGKPGRAHATEGGSLRRGEPARTGGSGGLAKTMLPDAAQLPIAPRPGDAGVPA